ncbi:Sgn1p SKDI_09G1640 [Saccharomyces kudriavzevii IFO 1802]|uniref:SGN1-like protein n=2 Tax=Saccharomyces kudriavzevii (strain ATCC MYA-4449 / AS 2.2408 / CBS 8840 / NBRC 1802 / NCYC 2889) TaxID=226230 RepID=J6EQ46_SACK1|nr:uncharacterized protein SKDI_09G1640 [Saccharomyces kudriavzevii IFO 1802]EJT44882.1 SGN1-like protein [Saccharomyces kudriavzevii IFO 1802]CAI4064903.1 hypothetical protein SKDI_09G1640 [Saccharomyces kudriavzevii IFO 1802]
MSQKEKVIIDTVSKAEASNSKNNSKQEFELDELVGKLSIEGAPQVSQKLSKEEKHAHQLEADSRSIFVGNITLDVTPEQIEEHFQDCGLIKRITLLYDRNTGAPKGYGYIEFESPAFREKALQLNGVELNGKKIAVSRKRTNIPGFNRHQNSQNQYFQQWQWNYPLMAYPNPDTLPYYPPYPPNQSPNQSFGYNKIGYYRGSYNNKHRNHQKKNHNGTKDTSNNIRPSTQKSVVTPSDNDKSATQKEYSE